MDHQLQELLHLGLKAQGFLGGRLLGFIHDFGHVPLSLVENRGWL
jgi:hypothetical protein